MDLKHNVFDIFLTVNTTKITMIHLTSFMILTEEFVELKLLLHKLKLSPAVNVRTTVEQITVRHLSCTR